MQILFTKSKIAIIFLLLTLLYLCARLRPIVSANVGIKSELSAVSKDVLLIVSYEYENSMLVQAILSSAVATLGISRWWSKKNKAQEQATNSSLGSDVRYATLRKLLTSPNKFLNDNWQALAIMPWFLTFLISTIINYITLVLVLQFFCESYYRVFIVYSRLQTLFLKNVFNASIKHLSQLCGILTDVTPYDDFVTVTLGNI